MVADNDEAIIKRKVSYIADVGDDVHMAESLINQGLSRNVHYMMAGLSKLF